VFAGKLAEAVDVDRARCIALPIRFDASSFQPEDIVGAEMNQRAIQIATGTSQFLHAPCIYVESSTQLFFGAIDVVVGGTVDDNAGSQAFENRSHPVRLAEI